MKKRIIVGILLGSMLVFSGSVFSQGAPPPPAGGGLGGSHNQNGGGAPLGDGVFILIGLAIGFGGIKYRQGKMQTGEQKSN